MLSKFYKEMNIEISIQEEQNRFVQRINQSIFDYFKKNPYYEEIFRGVCFGLGINADDQISIGIERLIFPHFRELTKDDFIRTQELIVVIHNYCQNKNVGITNYINHTVNVALSLSTCDLGVRWSEGMFYRSGDETLDRTLIEESRSWLKGYPEASQSFDLALKHYASKQYGDAMTNSFSALESLAKTYIGKDRTLDNLAEELVKKLQLNGDLGAVVKHYCKIAHGMSSRHGKRDANNEKIELPEDLVEFYIYFTGTFLRLIAQKIAVSRE